MDWAGIIGVAFTSSVVGGLITQAVDVFRVRNKVNRDNNYLSLRLAVIFERYCYDCTEIADQHETAIQSDGAAGRAAGALPEPPPLPKDDYSSFDLQLLDRVYEFPDRVLYARSEISHYADVVGHGEAHEVAYKNAVLLATNALKVADDLRTSAKLEKRELGFGEYDIRANLTERARKLNQ